MNLKRKLLMFLFCLVILLNGCRRKEEPEVPDNEVPDRPAETVEEEQPEAPPDAFHIIPNTTPTVYITKSPAKIGEYVNFLEYMGYSIPDRFEDAASDEPLHGITQQEAEAFAIWLLSRLPRESEWAKARDLVDRQPYPWDGPTPRSNAAIYLVRDWRSGEEGEREAKEKRDNMIQERTEEIVAKIAHNRDAVLGYVDEHEGDIKAQWRQMRNSLFEALDERKKSVEQVVLLERMHALEEILLRLQEKKLPLRTLYLDDEADEGKWESVINDYKAYVESIRNGIQQSKTDEVEKNKSLNDEVIRLKQRVEKLGEAKISGVAQLREKMPDTSDGVDSIKHALELNDELIELKGKAQSAAEDATEMYDHLLESIIQNFPEPQEVDQAAIESASENLDEREGILKKWGEYVDIEFEQEAHLFSDLRDFKRMRARREALTHELELLEKVISQLE